MINFRTHWLPYSKLKIQPEEKKAPAARPNYLGDLKKEPDFIPITPPETLQKKEEEANQVFNSKVAHFSAGLRLKIQLLLRKMRRTQIQSKCLLLQQTQSPTRTTPE